MPLIFQTKIYIKTNLQAPPPQYSTGGPIMHATPCLGGGWLCNSLFVILTIDVDPQAHRPLRTCYVSILVKVTVLVKVARARFGSDQTFDHPFQRPYLLLPKFVVLIGVELGKLPFYDSLLRRVQYGIRLGLDG